MKKILISGLALIHAAFPASSLFSQESDENTFITLNRRPTKISKLPTNISVISKEDIDRSGAKTVVEVLDRAPSVDLSRSGGLGTFTTLRMRGATTSGQVQIVVDGQSLTGLASQFVDLSMIPVDNVERIEIVRGGSSVLYGANTMGGVVHIITKRQHKEGVTAEAGYEGRSHKTEIVKGRVGALSGLFDILANASSTRSDGFQFNSDVDDEFFSLRSGLSFENGARVSAEVSHINKQAGISQGTLIPYQQWNGDVERVPVEKTERSEKDETQARFKVDIPISDVGVLQSHANVYDTNNISRPARDRESTLDMDIQFYGGDVRFLHSPGGTIGVSYQREQRQQITDSAFSARSFKPDVHVTDWGLYVVDDLNVGSKLTVTPALRFDQHKNFGSEYNPRLTVVYDILPFWVVSANVARAFRAPSFLELFAFIPSSIPAFSVFGNPNLDPEISWTYDFGNKFQIGKTRELKATAFFTRIRNRIEFTGNTYINQSRAEMAGVELEMKGRIGPFHDSVNYTYTRAKGNSLTSSDFVDLPLVPRHALNVGVALDIPRGPTVSNFVQYVSEQSRFNSFLMVKEILPSYAVWNARISQPVKTLEIFVGVNNILDRRYAESFDSDPATFTTTLVPQPDRTYMAGLNMTFGG